jgi:membrane protein
VLVLIGAEISFAHQHVDGLVFGEDCERTSHAFKRLIALRVVQLMSKKLSQGEPPLTATQISDVLDVPICLVKDTLPQLERSGLVSETATTGSEEPTYLPARDTDLLTIHYVVDALEKNGVDDIPIAQSPELNTLSQSLDAFGELIRKAPENKLLKHL